MSEERDFFVGLDLGSHKALCVVAKAADVRGYFQILGYGVVKSSGIRKGIIADKDAVVRDIRAVVEEAQHISGVTFSRVKVAVGGTSLSSVNGRGTTVIRGNEITQSDIKSAREHAKEDSRREGKRQVFFMFQGYRCGDDPSPRIVPPLGLTGDKLDVLYHAVYSSVSNMENLKHCMQRTGLDAESEPQPYAAALAVTRPADRYCGVAVFDIGEETTSVAVYHENSLLFTAVHPFGAELFTTDICNVFNVDRADAESLKMTAGSCVPDNIPQTETVQPIGVGVSALTYSCQLLARTLESRAEEFVGIYRQQLAREGLLSKISVIVLTGGGANLKGFKNIFEKAFNCPVRVNGPLYVQGSANLMRNPSASVAVGLVMAAALGKEIEPEDNRTLPYSKDLPRSQHAVP